MLQVLVGGGQEASQVTTTGSRAGNFQTRFFHKVSRCAMQSVRAHGCCVCVPVLTLASTRSAADELRCVQIYAEEFGSIRGHFGPINALKWHPDGRSFTSGGEDGYVRIHHLDSEYLGREF